MQHAEYLNISLLNGGGYSKEESSIIAGMAIFMMFFFHFFAYPDLQPTANCYYAPIKHLGIPIEEIFAPLGQMCVAIFAFNTGFAICKFSNSYIDPKKILNRVLKFLTAYWLVCILFLLYGIIGNKELPDTRTLIFNLLGFELSARATYINVCHAWYVSYYVILLVISPLLVLLLSRTNKYIDLLILISSILFVPQLPKWFLNTMWPLTSTISGYLVCKYDVFSYCKSMLKNRNKFFTCVMALTFLISCLLSRHFFRSYNAWFRLDGIYSFLFILSILLLIDFFPIKLKNALSYIGGLAMFLWFIHSIFAIGDIELRYVLYYPYFPLFITIWGILLSLPFAIICRKIHQSITEKMLISKKTINAT